MCYELFKVNRWASFCLLVFVVFLGACKKQPEKSTVSTVKFQKNELIIVYPPNLTQTIRTNIRLTLLAKFKIEKIETCVCDSSIELVTASEVHTLVNDSTSVRAPTSHENVVLNGYRLILSKNIQIKNPSIPVTLSFTPADYSLFPGSIRIAVIDSGIDTANAFTPSSYGRFLLPASAANYTPVGITNPTSINRSRYFGWNFIRNNQDIMDDNVIKHGTYVTGFILGQASGKGPQVIPLKVADANGVSSLSNILCALKFSELAKADIINASWGYDGIENLALVNAMNSLSAKNILMVTAAGNEGNDIGVNEHYPGSFSNNPARTINNIITVTAASSAAICNNTNYSNVRVDVGIAGPADDCGYTSIFYPSASEIRVAAYSSFATAIMTGIIANRYPTLSITAPLKEGVLNDALRGVPESPALLTKIRMGKRLKQ